MPRQGGVLRSERPEHPGPEGETCPEAPAEEGLLRPQGVQLLHGWHLQVRGEVHEPPPDRQDGYSRE